MELRLVRRWSGDQLERRPGWLWRLHRRRRDEGDLSPDSPHLRTTLYLHASRLALVIILTCTLGYGTLSLTGWWWYRRQLGDRVAFTDVAWPPRWPHLKQARADALFEQGFQALEEHRYSEAARLLSLALRRAPARDDARVALARIFNAFQEFSRAFALMDDALSSRPVSPELSQAAIALAFECEDYPRALHYADLTLAHLPTGGAAQRLFAQQSRVRALAALGRGSDASAAAETLASENDAYSFRCRIEALLAQENFPAAVRLGRAAQQHYPADLPLLDDLCRAARLAHDSAALAAVLDYAIAAQPDQTAPRATAVLAWWQAGDARRAFAALDDYLLRFDSDSDALYRLSTAATALGAVPLLDSIHARVVNLGHPSARFAANLIEAYLIKGDVAALRRVRPSLPALAATRDPVLQLWPKVVEAMFQVIDGNPLSSGLPLQNLMRQLHLPPPAYARFIEFLLAADRPAAACELLDQAVALFPASPTLNSLSPTARAALTAAHERTTLPEQALVILSEADFFPAAEALLIARDYAQLATLIATHRRASPPWLTQRRRDFDWLDLRRALAADDSLTTRAVAQLYLNGDPHRLEQAIALAASAPATQARDTLLQVILRAHPDAKPLLVTRGLLSADVASASTSEPAQAPR